MTYSMNLCDKPFKRIKDKTKTIEMRLNDERRKNLKIGDIIEFTHNNTKEVIKCEILNIYSYDSFDELYKHHNKISIGYLEDEIARPNDMLEYYTEDQINTYGVLAIEIKLL